MPNTRVIFSLLFLLLEQRRDVGVSHEEGRGKRTASRGGILKRGSAHVTRVGAPRQEQRHRLRERDQNIVFGCETNYRLKQKKPRLGLPTRRP